MIESGFNPVACHGWAAKGLCSSWHRRRGFTAFGSTAGSTSASIPRNPPWRAAGYLNDLYVRYGSWELAQAAYNAGEVKVDKAIRATGSADFWDLRQIQILAPGDQGFRTGYSGRDGDRARSRSVRLRAEPGGRHRKSTGSPFPPPRISGSWLRVPECLCRRFVRSMPSWSVASRHPDEPGKSACPGGSREAFATAARAPHQGSSSVIAPGRARGQARRFTSFAHATP